MQALTNRSANSGPLSPTASAHDEQDRIEFLDLGAGPVNGDHSSLVQCFSNLLQNALEFVPKDRVPNVRVRSEPSAETIRITVSDNGIGIDPKLPTRIVGMFERAGPLDVPGTGIGLAIVKKAVERMGGELGVQSELGAGACFWIELPKAKS